MSDRREFGRRWAVLAIAIALAMVACIGGEDEPSLAACPTVPTTRTNAGGWVDMEFCSGGTSLAASLYEPEGAARAAAVFVHGSGEHGRLAFDNPVVKLLLHAGVAVLTYDKRGIGASEGDCCPGDDGDFEAPIGDAQAAIRALRGVPSVRGLPTGIYGESQAAWIAPRAGSAAGIDFLIMISAPAISVGEELLHEELVAEGLESEAILERLVAAPPKGADPRSEIAGLRIPMLWIYGMEDSVIPVEYSQMVLSQLADTHGLDVSVEVFEGAGHAVIHRPELRTTVQQWLAAHVTEPSA